MVRLQGWWGGQSGQSGQGARRGMVFRGGHGGWVGRLVVVTEVVRLLFQKWHIGFWST